MSVKAVTAGGGDTTIELDRLYEIINILGKRDCRMLLPLWESDPADDDDVQDFSQRGNHFSAMNNVAFDNDPYVLGDLLAYRLNGVDEALDMADHDDFSFGADGTAPNEPAFSLIIGVKFDSVVGISSLIGRYDVTGGSEEIEYIMYVQAGGSLTISSYDAVGIINRGRSSSVALNINQWYVIIGTYNGSRTVDGFRLFVNGIRVDDTNETAGAYIAMHNMAVVTSVGYYENAAGVLTGFLCGDFALPAITARQLTDGGVATGVAATPFSDVARLTRLYQEVLGI